MDRFFSKIIKTDFCWNFVGANRGNGYGCIKVEGKVIDAHRLSYILHIGKIPKGINVCHKCDNRKCVNPDHLFLGTQKENMQDCKSKGRLIMPTNISGRFKPNTYPKNTAIPLSRALEIKSQVLNRGKLSLKEIALKNKVSYQYVRDISANRILKNREVL